MFELGTDEITLVLQPTSHLKSRYRVFEWERAAEDLISRFALKADFITIFGKKQPIASPPSGYTTAYTFGEHNFFLAVSYHPYYMNMGVAVKFSAQAWDYYREKSGLEICGFLKAIKSVMYKQRISRIDFVADYIDEGINTTEIYQNLMDDRVGIFRENEDRKTGKKQFKRCPMNYRGFIKEGDVPTIYIGSSQSKSQLRVYDKKMEQIERKGSKYDKAVKCHDRVRFEGIFRHEYAHQISGALEQTATDDQYANLIACVLLQKFRFMYIDNGVPDGETEYTQKLIDSISNNSFALNAPSSRNYEFARSMGHMFQGSGVMQTFYKIREIWGMDALKELLDYIAVSLDEYAPNDDCRYWLNKNTGDYRKNYPDFDKFLMQNVFTVLKKGA